jgi:trimethylamine--corrinoid protein Co-methyltransferase
VEVVESVGPEGQFLNTDHTLEYYRERWYPNLFDRSAFDSWIQDGGKSAEERAVERIGEILEEHKPTPLPKTVQKDLQRVVERAESNTR